MQAVNRWWSTWWPLWPKEPRDDGTTHLKVGTVAFDHHKHWSEQRPITRRGVVVSVSVNRGYGSLRFGGKWRGWPRVEWVPK